MIPRKINITEPRKDIPITAVNGKLARESKEMKTPAKKVFTSDERADIVKRADEIGLH